jgi:hypothetical protein
MSHLPGAWVGLHVEPEAARVLGSELIWIGVAGRCFDFARADRLCAARVVYQVVFQYDGKTVATDFAGAPSFRAWVESCRRELITNPPTFNSDADAKLTCDTVCKLFAESERLSFEQSTKPL